MKTIISSPDRLSALVKIGLIALMLFNAAEAYSQNKRMITGRVIDERNNQSVPYASISLLKSSDLKLLQGTLSDTSGLFRVGPVVPGTYKLMVNFLGYKPASRIVEVVDDKVTDAGVILLQDTLMSVAEAVVTAERTRAKTESNRTTFFVSQKMVDASGTGTDILKLIPGIQIDLMQNITVEGSRDIVIYVDGKERDRSFVSQLSPDQIDKVQIVSVPTASYDGNVSKALNIVMKKNRDSGFSGQFYSEIPATSSVIYIFPSFSMSYGNKKLNLNLSYKGEIAYMDLHESLYRETWTGMDSTEYKSDQYLRQKNQNHRFSYGFDYFISAHDVLNFYAYCNPYYLEYAGTAGLRAEGSVNASWLAAKDNKFTSTGTLYSLFYKHTFEKTGRELSLDISNNNLTAKNTNGYINLGDTDYSNSLTSVTKPSHNGLNIKVDYNTPAGKNLSISSGVKASHILLEDACSPDFRYTETILASYGSLAYKPSKYELSAGLRIEKSFTDLEGGYRRSFVSLLPDAAVRYKISSRQNLLLSYKRTVRRPNLYQISPYISNDDPISIHRGNPFLKPELSDYLALEYSMQSNKHYFSSKLIYLATTSTINNLTILNGSGQFEARPGNLGTMYKFGWQFSGAIKIKNLSLNPYLLLFASHSSVSDSARYYGAESRRQVCLETGLSAVWSFKKDFALSSVFNYNTPQNNIQDNYFCDALYFVSFDKTFRNGIKAGIGSGLMFTRSFVHSASDIETSDFRSVYRGYVTMPSVPFWFRLSYKFNSGKARKRIDYKREDVNLQPEKAF